MTGISLRFVFCLSNLLISWKIVRNQDWGPGPWARALGPGPNGPWALGPWAQWAHLGPGPLGPGPKGPFGPNWNFIKSSYFLGKICKLRVYTVKKSKKSEFWKLRLGPPECTDRSVSSSEYEISFWLILRIKEKFVFSILVKKYSNSIKFWNYQTLYINFAYFYGAE